MGNMIDDSQEPVINNWISDYQSKTTVEIGVITINELPQDKVVEDYALSQFRRLGVGKAGSNNGILIVVSKNDRKWNITTGYGIEGILTDYDCSRIGNNILVPHFKNGDYLDGIMATLEGIKSKVGTDNIEDKKAWLQKQKEEEARQMHQAIENFKHNATLFLSVLLGLGLIVFAVRKRLLIIKEQNRLEDEINEYISKIEHLKSEFSSLTKLPNSELLTKLHNDCSDFFASIKIHDNQKNHEKKLAISWIYDSAVEKVIKYSDFLNQKTEFLNKVDDIQNVKDNVNMRLKEAAGWVKKIKKYGYNTSEIPSSSEVEQLFLLIGQISLMVKTDVDSAQSKYSTYEHKMSQFNDKIDRIYDCLRSIENAKERCKNWKSEVSELKSDFVRSGGDLSELEKHMLKFSNYISESSDWIEIESKLNNLLSWMNVFIYDYQRKIQQEEEMRRIEEKKRRKKREEEERRISSYSSSSSSSSWSSSSSSSSWSGFGGGSSGGGGASGSW
jgi:uncharacterized membrane protein YgcG